ncbi:MAG: DNA-binding protein [Rhodanobacter sp.]|nr:MAG: DNA-binding protein [Rhodanobacter sp.]
MSNTTATPASTADADWTTGHEALLYEACGACGQRSYFRRGFCPRCGATPVDLRASERKGTVYAATAVVRAPSPEWKALAPYPLLLVDLDEGPRVMAHGTTGLAIGDRVQINFLRLGERLIPRAEPILKEEKASS